MGDVIEVDFLKARIKKENEDRSPSRDYDCHRNDAIIGIPMIFTENGWEIQ